MGVTSLPLSRVAPGWHGPGCTLPGRLSVTGSACPCLLSTGSSHPWVTSPQLTPGDSQPSAPGGALGGGEGAEAGVRGRSYPPGGSLPAGTGSRCAFVHPRGTVCWAGTAAGPVSPPHGTRGRLGCAPRAQRAAELPRGLRGLSRPSAGPVPTPAHGSCAFQGKNAHFQVSSRPPCPQPCTFILEGAVFCPPPPRIAQGCAARLALQSRTPSSHIQAGTKSCPGCPVTPAWGAVRGRCSAALHAGGGNGRGGCWSGWEPSGLPQKCAA